MGDPLRAGVLASELQGVGFIPTLAFSPAQVVRALDADDWDVLVVDSGLRQGAQPRLLPALSERTDATILVLGPDDDDTAPNGMHRRQHGEQLSSAMPFSEIATRAAMTGRTAKLQRESRTVAWGPCRLDVGRRQAYVRSQQVEVTPLQFRILLTLTLAEGSVVTVQELSRSVWGTGLDNAERVFAHIRRLRRRVEVDPSRPGLIVTVRGEGIRLDHP